MGCRYNVRNDNFNEISNDNFNNDFNDNRVAGISFDNRSCRCDWVWNGYCWRCQCGPICCND